MKVKCQVIEDLMPLYIDEVCSNESKMIVEEHLKECKACSDKFAAQNSILSINVNLIKKNLKSKDPFKKIKRHQLIRLIIILISIPIIFLSVIEISGDGIGFSALYGRYNTERFLSSIENEKFETATRYGHFTGAIYKTSNDEKLAKEQWIIGMENLKESGIIFVSHNNNTITTDDRFTKGSVIISVEYDDVVYDFILFIVTNSGKVEPSGLQILPSQNTESNAIEKILIQKISEVLNTYNPG